MQNSFSDSTTKRSFRLPSKFIKKLDIDVAFAKQLVFYMTVLSIVYLLFVKRFTVQKYCNCPLKDLQCKNIVIVYPKII